ncbi:hypothetical protein FHX82_005140 [Amycolatopsis bartoniae]|uniref:SPW repeat-containing integral membrane domain-containing protein n=1 Tax=Amycolatopsis bartoniae TaxID=941986 RepID=A0A8H9ITW4_9PSEU|nr:SPW repeat protein [Amycolatopsis bartoniae]MBB2938064.1 hypothetical protein [Amycolatopsis bartoniae]TVT09928.1 hypothetical protein FNH07_06655 [Amycolatopsis bartoniae]GHF32432.1 hypothetical protein GCM10017566_01220 [Amycolatopsis bartoniae]
MVTDRAGEPRATFPVARHLWVGGPADGHVTPSLPSSLVFLAAVWLGFAPFALHYHFATLNGAADINDVDVALVVATLALVRMIAPRDLPWLSVVNAALGAWLVASPFVLGYAGSAPRATVNEIAVGTALVLLGASSAVLTYRERRLT